MNMMEMAAMEEAWNEDWSKEAGWMRRHMEQCPISAFRRPKLTRDFEKGFRAGVAWARRQVENKLSSQAVGNISQYQGEAEEPEDEA